ncbi:S24 family peptidase [Hymenobacter psychrophilus]|uniref:Phage repressor protein C, contains Cro/C1-type HTH and peptisase s24 domains n=1 Tax=Hymenobacter psychrophilus TaxID=651662 RepID=A0A1H3LV28_9BACT|nr:S24 family peptidase [Hymenobacter psychrophilus]SDY67884.1 Phage repressor protein C, contains Cro/C1-type HTH and peptisase s24 domains [Hymenobacter psychrophilus]
METTENQKKKLPAGVDGDTGARIKQLFEHHGITTYEANQRMGYTRTSKLYKVLSGDVRPSYETLVDILSEFPEVSPDWLLMGKGEMQRAQVAKPAVGPTGDNTQVLTLTMGLDGKPNIELVPILAQAGYSLQHNEAVYLEDLPKYRIPGFEHGTFRAFEVAGDSMEPTIRHADVVLVSWVENPRLLELGEVYVVVTDESVMLKRIKQRITSGTKEVMLFSDNPHRTAYDMDVADIRQLWRVRGYVSRYIPSAPDLTVERLWNIIDALGIDRSKVQRHLDEDATSDATL